MDYSVQFSSVTQSCPTLFDPMNRSTPGLPVHHQLPEFTQTQRPSSPWCHPAISSSVVPFSSCPQSLPASESIAAKSLQSCPTLCNPIDDSPPGSPVPGILQARTLEWVAISFSNAWKWIVKGKSLSHVWLLAIPWTTAYQAPPSMGFSRQEYWSGLPLPSPVEKGPNQCTSPKQLALCIEPGLATRLIHDIIHVSMPLGREEGSGWGARV